MNILKIVLVSNAVLYISHIMFMTLFILRARFHQ